MLAAVAALIGSMAAAQAKAAILVGRCIENDPCWANYPPDAWSHALTGGDLASLGLGTNVPLVAVQTSQYVIQLGVTKITFSTPSGPVQQSLGEFTGTGYFYDPCNQCEVDIVGSFFIPANATSALIDGTFGNSRNPTSAGVDVFLGPVPEPSSGLLVIAGLIGLGMLRKIGA